MVCVKRDALQNIQSPPIRVTTAPRVFTKCLAVVAAHLRRQNIHVFPYLDDWFTKASTLLLCQHTQNTINLLHQLGFTISFQKSHLQPLQVQPYLGAIPNTAGICLYQYSKHPKFPNATTIFPTQSTVDSQNYHAPTGYNGNIHRHSAKCMATHVSASVMSSTTVASVTGSIRGPSVDRQPHSSFSAVVEHKQPVKRAAFPLPCSPHHPDKRTHHCKAGVLTQSHSQGSLEHQTPGSLPYRKFQWKL